MRAFLGPMPWIATLLAAALPASAVQARSAPAQNVQAQNAQADSAPAQPADAVDLAGDRITIGLGVATFPRYIGAASSTILPVIAVQGQVAGRSFSTQGTNLTIDAIAGGGKPGWKVQAGPTLNVRTDRTARIGQPQVAALGKLATAWEPGAWLGIQRTGVVTSPYDTFSASVSWQRDVAGAYGGAIVSPGVSYGTPLSHRDYVSLNAGADHVGRRFGDYYYDIDAAGSARSGLRAYAGADRAGWKDWNLGLLAAHSVRGTLTHGIGLFATAGYARLLGSYAASPVVADVGDRGQWSGAAGLVVTL